MKLQHRAELAGRVKLQISGGKRGTIDYPWFDNMILDQGLRSLLTKGGATTTLMIATVAVGSSSQPVSATDIGVIEPVAKTSAASSTTNGWNSSGFGWTRATASFSKGGAAGNLSEVTIGNANNYTDAYCRALIKDGAGNPTTITVLADEVLSVTWEIRRWWSNAPDHLIEYDDGDGGIATTTVSYKPISAMGKNVFGLGSGGTNGFGGSLTGDFRAEKTVWYSESSGNPAIATAGTPVPGNAYLTFPSEGNYATFTPPIPKTNEFTVAIVWELTLARRGE